MDDKNLKKRLKYIENKISKNGTATVKDTAVLLQRYAQDLAPKESRELIRFINITPVIITKDRTEYTVGFSNQGFGSGNPHPQRTWGGAEFSLPFWMQPDEPRADSLIAESHFKTGKRDFLYQASKLVEPRFKDRTVRLVKDALQVKIN
jgi:hypothetical protein